MHEFSYSMGRFVVGWSGFRLNIGMVGSAIGQHGRQNMTGSVWSSKRGLVGGVGCAIVNHGQSQLTNHCIEHHGSAGRRSLVSGVQPVNLVVSAPTVDERLTVSESFF